MRTQRYLSIGHLAQLFQRDIGNLQSALNQLGIRPTLLLNDIAHYTAADVERLRNHFRKGEEFMSTTAQNTAEITRLVEENRELRVQLDRTAAANRYLRRVESLIADGTPRAEAVRIASREDRQGRNAFLKSTNSRIVHRDIDPKPKIVRR
jgi:hypothetical protein